MFCPTQGLRLLTYNIMYKSTLPIRVYMQGPHMHAPPASVFQFEYTAGVKHIHHTWWFVGLSPIKSKSNQENAGGASICACEALTTLHTIAKHWHPLSRDINSIE